MCCENEARMKGQENEGSELIDTVADLFAVRETARKRPFYIWNIPSMSTRLSAATR